VRTTNANRKAVFYGPDLLAGILGDKEPQPEEIPVFVSSNPDPSEWIKAKDIHALRFETAGVAIPKNVKLIIQPNCKRTLQCVLGCVYSAGMDNTTKKIRRRKKKAKGT
jgi:hypothetical protein